MDISITHPLYMYYIPDKMTIFVKIIETNPERQEKNLSSTIKTDKMKNVLDQLINNFKKGGTRYEIINRVPLLTDGKNNC